MIVETEPKRHFGIKKKKKTSEDKYDSATDSRSNVNKKNKAVRKIMQRANHKTLFKWSNWATAREKVKVHFQINVMTFSCLL